LSIDFNCIPYINNEKLNTLLFHGSKIATSDNDDFSLSIKLVYHKNCVESIILLCKIGLFLNNLNELIQTYNILSCTVQFFSEKLMLKYCLRTTLGNYLRNSYSIKNHLKIKVCILLASALYLINYITS